ncbi:helix-turn-helix domain-containing protein [Stutzerimonas nitrititolerans]|uniref:helix-turn-helix domain-containing protein n=1 Tax=Stutzerimonas nitrititolerans TaxID=2482751 RepID=UPI0028A67115|nr:XRE family transcriptional regulator [Stutzerimonas nitrititolerans]
MKIGASIRAARLAKGLTLEKLALEAGTDAGSLSRLERDIQGISKEVLERLLRLLDISLSSAHFETSADADSQRRDKIPLISWAQAACWDEVTDIYAVSGVEEWLSCPVPHGPRTFAVRISGESMHNPHERVSFKDGDIVLVDPDRAFKHRSFVVAKLPGAQEATFRQLLEEGGEKFLKALNPNWPDQFMRINSDAELRGVGLIKLESLL